MANPKVVLAYSGGLDTSVAIKWLQDQGYDVVACCLDVGEGKDLNFIQQKHFRLVQFNLMSSMQKKNSHRILHLLLCRHIPFMKESIPLSLHYLDL